MIYVDAGAKCVQNVYRDGLFAFCLVLNISITITKATVVMK